MPFQTGNFFKLLGFNVVAAILILFITESILRLSGLVPGLIVDRAPFNTTDSIYLYKDYTADENGIMKFSREGREFVAKGIANNGSMNEGGYILINMLIHDFVELNNGGIENEFSRFIQRIKENPDPDEVELAYLNYCFSPINSDGFRSIEFKNYQTGKLKLLLLGDSHAYGAEASNITYSFADNLAAKGYVVYNTGIIATDPAQYLAVAKQYIPQLQPDFVIVNFCLNNDIVYFKREVKPYQMVFYPTNVENIMACPDGEYLVTPQEAYQFVLDECYIPQQDKKRFNRFAAQTVLGTKLWLVLKKAGCIKIDDEEKQAYLQRTAALKSDESVSDFFLEQIRKIGDRHGAHFILSGIPDGDDLDKRPPDVPGLFKNIKYHIPERTTKADRAEGGHFNDQGYEKYADFLHNIIDSIANK